MIRTKAVTAMTGIAATLIHGRTTHMTLELNQDSIPNNMIDAWSDTRLLMVDECSFASFAVFKKICENTTILKTADDRSFNYFGGLNVVFLAGDFSQLEPLCTQLVYKGDECNDFHCVLNLFVELEGQKIGFETTRHLVPSIDV
jgi:hypothetical protein